MRYHVTIGYETYEVDLSGERATINGEPVAAELAALPDTPVAHLLVDGRSYALVSGAREERGRWDIHLDGHRFEAEAIDQRTHAIREAVGEAAAAQGPSPVSAPMPGKVVRLEVEQGESVERGQGIAVVEAMKMENELKAEADAIVSRVAVAAGDAVDKGEVLVEFEAE